MRVVTAMVDSPSKAGRGRMEQVLSPPRELQASPESLCGDIDTKVPKRLLERLQYGPSYAKLVQGDVTENDTFRTLDYMLRRQAHSENKQVRRRCAAETQ